LVFDWLRVGEFEWRAWLIGDGRWGREMGRTMEKEMNEWGGEYHG
jgi:hypothetical protein